MQYTKVVFPIRDVEMQEILAALLAEYAFDSFDNDEQHLFAFVPTALYRKEEVLEVLQQLQQNELPFTVELVEEKNWNEEWEKNFEPVVINSHLSIRAPFHSPQHTDMELVIEPKMSFGTGHHATTHMMCEMMLNMNFSGQQILDFGSGTGILSILASKLNALRVMGIDNEEWAVTNSIENAIRNNCDNLTFKLGEEELINEEFDIVLANINRHIILSNIDVITGAVKKGGILLISGILNTDEDEMKMELSKYQFKHIQTMQKDQWSAMHYHKQILE